MDEMNYTETLDFLFSQLPMFQRVGGAAYKVDLSNTVALCNMIGNPQEKLKFVHIAGTNGKGSTSHMIAAVLQAAGYKTGLYTSPHLKDFRERIKINGDTVSKHFVIGFIRRNLPFLSSNKLSFFEMTVGMAFEYFAKQKIALTQYQQNFNLEKALQESGNYSGFKNKTQNEKLKTLFTIFEE